VLNIGFWSRTRWISMRMEDIRWKPTRSLCAPCGITWHRRSSKWCLVTPVASTSYDTALSWAVNLLSATAVGCVCGLVGSLVRVPVLASNLAYVSSLVRLALKFLPYTFSSVLYLYHQYKKGERGGDPNNLGRLILYPTVHLAPMFVGKTLSVQSYLCHCY
jgi:hypothetical protein